MSTLSIYAAGQWYDVCAGERADIAIGGAFHQIKPGDFVYANGDWQELCPTPIYVGLAPVGISRTNTTNPGYSNQTYKLWFTTTKNRGTSLYGDDSGPPLSNDVKVSFQFRPEGNQPPSAPNSDDTGQVRYQVTGAKEGDVEPTIEMVDPPTYNTMAQNLSFNVYLKQGFKACAIELEVQCIGDAGYQAPQSFRVTASSDKNNMDSQLTRQDMSVDWGYISVFPTETQIILANEEEV